MKLLLNKESGLINTIPYFASPNVGDRPRDVDIDLLVIHAISLPPNQFGGNAVIDFFTNQLDVAQHEFYHQIKDLKVSAHLFIRRDGALIQFVPLHRRAWHAGVSEFMGRSDCNDFSIGIELEGCDDMPFEPAQYAKLITVTKLIQAAYPNISNSHIVGHCDIAPDRKTDPGPHFDWTYYKGQLT